MWNIVKRIILLMLFLLNLFTLLLEWQNIQRIRTLNGMLVISGNMILSCLIVGLYFISILFYAKEKTVFFITGLCSLCMLFALEFSKFEAYGRFNNSSIGVYLGLSTIIINIVAYILLLGGGLSDNNNH